MPESTQSPELPAQHRPTDHVFCYGSGTDYDARCPACWLGFSHNYAMHWLSIALYEVWGKHTGQHTRRPLDTDPTITGYIRYHFFADWRPELAKLAKLG